MPRKVPAKRRRESKVAEEEENPKDSKNQKVQTTPTQDAPSKAINPPSLQIQSNPKVKGMPPPPIAEEQNGDDDDDMVSPTMKNPNTTSSAISKKGKASSKSNKQSSDSPVKEEAEAPSEEKELEEETPSSGATFFGEGFVAYSPLFLLSFLLGCILQLSFLLHSERYAKINDDTAIINDKAAKIVEAAVRIHEESIDLVDRIRYYGRQQLHIKYGPGPIYQVELALEFPAAGGGSDDINVEYMTIDLYGDSMPHAVFTFMSQVESGLYNTRGFGFHHSGDHIVLGSPMGLDEYGNEFGQVWEYSGVARLLFQEHSKVVPHVPYTIGFSGRGPNLYFNMMDNTEAHRDARDPCFGSISRGTNLADWMHSLAGTLNPGDWKEMETYVIIRSANTILPP